MQRIRINFQNVDGNLETDNINEVLCPVETRPMVKRKFYIYACECARRQKGYPVQSQSSASFSGSLSWSGCVLFSFSSNLIYLHLPKWGSTRIFSPVCIICTFYAFYFRVYFWYLVLWDAMYRVYESWDWQWHSDIYSLSALSTIHEIPRVSCFSGLYPRL